MSAGQYCLFFDLDGTLTEPSPGITACLAHALFALDRPVPPLAELHRSRGDVAEAEALLDRCLREHPRFLGAVLPLASVMLARGARTNPTASHRNDRRGFARRSTRA